MEKASTSEQGQYYSSYSVLYCLVGRLAHWLLQQSWRARQKRWLTNCNKCWTPQFVCSAVPISSTEACHDSSVLSYIGWMFLSESCTNSASWCSTACTVKHLSTSWNCANQSQVSYYGNIFDLPPNSSWSYHVTSSAPMADGLSVWLVRRSGIPRRTACVIRLLAGTVSDNLWRRFCSQHTEYWCIQRIRGFTTMRYIKRLFTYLLT